MDFTASPQHAAAENWVRAYRRAWESNDRSDIEALFTTDGTYRTEPWSDPLVGHDAIVTAWIGRADASGSTRFEWQVIGASDGLVFIQGETKYDSGETYSNLWVVRLAGDSRATEFTEWWMDQADPS